MAQTYPIRWKAWYGDELFDLTFPDDWEIIPLPMKNVPDIGSEGIAKALSHPIGFSSIRELARGNRSCAIAFDDLSRPTRAARILPLLLQMLLDGGIEEARITLIASLGAHRTMFRQDLVKKCSQEVVDRFRILNHQPFDNLVDLGHSSKGTPIRINKDFWEADLKIGVGCITPHSYAGFGGGGKIVLPGVSGIETLEANHGPAWQGLKCKMTDVDGNPCREDIEEIAKTIGLKIVIDAVSGPSREIVGLFAGDPIMAHREGVRYALEVYGTDVPANLDIAVLNAYPKDTDTLQTPNAFNLPLSMDRRLVRKGGALVVVSACTEGAGFHGLEGYGMRLYGQIDTFDLFRKALENSRLFLFSPNVNVYDVNQYYSHRVTFCNRWKDLIEKLGENYPTKARVGIVPCASLQIVRGQ